MRILCPKCSVLKMRSSKKYKEKFFARTMTITEFRGHTRRKTIPYVYCEKCDTIYKIMGVELGKKEAYLTRIESIMDVDVKRLEKLLFEVGEYKK